MLFNSYIFWVFLAVVIFFYRLLPHRGQNWLLLAASNLFYGLWDWRFLFLIWFSIGVDFVAGKLIERGQTERERKLPVIISICINLGLLAFFKYYGFFANEAVQALNAIGINASLPLLRVVLPVGISFYTFQSISYTVDVYRKQTKAEHSLVDYAVYVFFFPQLVAGPIERSWHLLGQVKDTLRNQQVDFRLGLYHIVFGLFKKVVVADNMAAIANTIFRTDISKLSGMECLIGIYAFAFQIYGDFSGYSSIAKGVARWLGFDLMDNFRNPYLAKSPSDFWGRWHISLSSWLRDYFYISIGGNRNGRWKTYRNLMLTMVVGGLWHGANWTFLAWGAFHGALLCAYRMIGAETSKKTSPEVKENPFLNGAKIFLMFHFICFSWLLFRADTIGQAWGMMKLVIFDLRATQFAWFGLSLILFYAGPLFLYELWVDKKKDLEILTRYPWLPRGLAYSYWILMLWFFPAPVHNEFIYFQF